MFFDGEAPVSYGYFVNLKNLPAQILGGAHRVALCVSFIEVSVRACMWAYASVPCLKKMIHILNFPAY